MKNKSLLITIAILIVAMSSVAQVTGTFTDSRDGKTYKTVKIGTQTWMAENLAYKAKSGCWAYDNDTTNVAQYGYLYNWKTAKKVCPAGWHLPTNAEWTTLINYLCGDNIAGGKLKLDNTVATNSSGFTAIPGGVHDYGGNFWKGGGWWSSTLYHISNAWLWGINENGIIYRMGYDKRYGFSVRCVMDN